MRTAALESMIDLASPSAGPFGLAVSRVIEGGMVSPRLLEQELIGAGYSVVHEPMEVRHRCVVIDDAGTTVALGISDSPGDALLQAVYAELKEEVI